MMLPERTNPFFGTAVKFVDAFVYAPHDPQKQEDKASLIKTVANPRLAKRQRFLAGIHLANSLVPFRERLANHIQSAQSLPFTENNPQLFALGGEHTVFMLDTNGSKHVLKIDRASIGMNEQDLNARAMLAKKEYETIKDWFKDSPGLIPDEHVVLVQSHIFKHPAVGIVQPYFPYGKGVFEEYTQDQLVALLQKRSALKKSFVTFARKLIEIQEEQHLSIDIIGQNNLSLLNDNELVFLDPHVIYNLDDNQPDSIAKPILVERVRELNQILEIVD